VIIILNLRKDKIMGIHPEECKHGAMKAKRHNFLLFIFYFSLFLAVCGLSCKPKTPAQSDANTPKSDTVAETTPDTTDTTAKTAVETAVDSVVVTVNGVFITESKLEALVEEQFAKIAAKTTQLPPEFAKQYKQQIRTQMLEKLIVEQLLDEKVKEAGIVITEEEVMASLKEQISKQQPSLTLEAFQAMYEARGQNFDELKQQFRKSLGYQKIVMAQGAGEVTVTEEEVEKYYSENQQKFELPEQVRASHILIKPDASDPNTDPNEAKAIARSKAQDLLEQIKAGADFAELAKAHSGCPSGPNGGDLSFFGRGAMVPPFEKAAFELEPGQVSDVVETKFGYHIIKVTDHKEAGVSPFEEVKTRLINELTQRKQLEAFQNYVQSLKNEADIVYPIDKKPKSDTSIFSDLESQYN